MDVKISDTDYKITTQDTNEAYNSIYSTSKSPTPKWIPDWIIGNPFFSAGVGLFGISFCASAIRRLVTQGIQLSERRLLTTLEIPSKDRSYQWVMQWLVANSKSSRHLGVETTFKRDGTGHTSTSFDFVPSTGRHWMKYDGTYLIVNRTREKGMVDLQSGLPWETLTLTTLASQRKKLESLLTEAKNRALQKEKGKTIIYHSVGQDWRPFGFPKEIRPFTSVILAERIAEHILRDVKHFLSSDKWYLQTGIPYRRGYLLYGPPGCGKTSFVLALAGALNYNICLLNLSDPFLTDDRLQYLLATPPPRTLILLEDIDGAVHIQQKPNLDSITDKDSEVKRRPERIFPETNMQGFKHNVTYSGVLNALDGAVATEERIIFMTTNYLNKLPGSLIRPGRVDFKIFIGWATETQLEQMFLRFFPGNSTYAATFATTLRNSRLSMAEVQSIFLFSKNKPEHALNSAQKWALPIPTVKDKITVESNQ